ncbi:TPA: hypothetical protein ACH3X1_009897 [Trebouxia sp. C0004]
MRAFPGKQRVRRKVTEMNLQQNHPWLHLCAVSRNIVQDLYQMLFMAYCHVPDHTRLSPVQEIKQDSSGLLPASLQALHFCCLAQAARLNCLPADRQPIIFKPGSIYSILHLRRQHMLQNRQ